MMTGTDVAGILPTSVMTIVMNDSGVKSYLKEDEIGGEGEKEEEERRRRRKTEDMEGGERRR